MTEQVVIALITVVATVIVIFEFRAGEIRMFGFSVNRVRRPKAFMVATGYWVVVIAICVACLIFDR